MPELKRITISNNTPNDQGGIIPNEVIDFDTRFKANPVMLKGHNWEGDSLGDMTDIRFENESWTALPVFHRLTEDSRLYDDLYQGGWLRSCSIGGEAIWKQTGRKIKDANGNITPDYVLDANGLRTCERFLLYEVSMVFLPSNPDAVTKMRSTKRGENGGIELETPELLAAKLYEPENSTKIFTKLSSKFNKTTMENEVVELTEDEKTEASAVALKAKQDKAIAEKAAKEKTILAAGADTLKQTVPWLDQWINKNVNNSTKITFEAAAKLAAPAIADPTGTEKTEHGKKTSDGPQAAGPIGLAAKKLDEEKTKAADAVKKAEEAKEAAEKDPACMAAYEAAAGVAKECMASMAAAEKAYNDAMDEDEDMKASKEKSTNAAKRPEPKFTKLSVAEIQAAGLKIIPMQNRQSTVGGDNSNIPEFSKLYSIGPKGAMKMDPILEKLTTGREIGNLGYDSMEKARVLLASMMKDPKYKTLLDATRFNYRSDLQRHEGQRIGLGVKELYGRMQSGNYEVLDRGNMLRRGNEVTKLTATDTFLASPDLYAIDFLTLAIFQLFPSNGWKKDIPMFGAADAENNTGLVWANITASPAVAIGSPGTPSNYTYTDTAVSISPVPFFLQPMEWFPYLMHQLRYDQMGTGWAQAFAEWAAVMDDYMIWQLASQLPTTSFVSSTGISGYQTAARNINVTANGPNSFYWNPTYANTLLGTVVNDIITTEQIYMKQNFQLDQPNQKPVLIIDPTTWGSFGQDPQFQSLLTRWVESNNGEFIRYAHTDIIERSRVAVINTATNTVVNPYSGSIPALSVGANLGLIPSQAGIAISALDVFMRQEPSSYGYLMSADMRMGANWLRGNFNGGVLYNYGIPPVPPA